jgi:putative Mn2+ efflux pump MntP
VAILLIALALSADCFAVALSSNISGKTLSFLQIVRVSLSFGAFQAIMPVLGWLAGRTIVDLIADYDHWLAFILLAVVGSRMVWESFHNQERRSEITDVTKAVSLLILSVATSIDALALGLSFAFLKTNIVLASTTIGIVAFIVTTVGLTVGEKVGNLMGKRAEAIGGVILIGIGVRIVLEHIL